MLKTNKKGFTLIELLVVIAIIGLLSTLAVVALNSAREKARDAKRVADVKQIQTALELYFNDAQGYPVQTITLGLSASTDVLCIDTAAACTGTTCGFLATEAACNATADDRTTYMGLVPEAPTPPAGDLYTYTSAASGDYDIDFTLEGKTGSLQKGAQCASPSGITSGSC